MSEGVRRFVFSTIVAACALAAAYGSQAVVDRDAVRPEVLDFRVYRCAAVAIRERRDPYTIAPSRACEHARGREGNEPAWAVTPFVLPGYAAAEIVPLAFVPFETGRAAWAAALFAAVAVAIAATAAVARVPVYAVACVFAPTVGSLNLLYGEPVPIAIAALCLAALALRNGRPALAAVGVAVAMIEPHVAAPAALALFAFERDARRPLLAAAAVLLGLSLAATGGATTLAYVTTILPAQQHAELIANDQYGLSHLALVAGLAPRAAMTLGSISYVATTSAALVLVARLRRRGRPASLTVLVPVALAMLGGPFVHDVQIAAAVPAAVVVATRVPAAWLALALLSARVDEPVRSTIVLVTLAIAGSARIAFPLVAPVRRAAAAGIAAAGIVAFARFDLATKGTPRADVVAGRPPVALPDDAPASLAWEWRIRLTPTDSTPRAADTIEKIPAWLALAILPTTLAVTTRERTETGRRFAGLAACMQHDVLLVHGAFSNAGVFAKIVPRLEAGGARVTAVDLPGHTAADAATAGEVTMDAYVARVVAALDEATSPVILVGHSMGGMVVSAAAEARPERVAALVYVCALLPESGTSLLAYNATDTQSVLGGELAPDPAAGVATLSRAGKLDALLNNTPEADRAIVLDYTFAEPLQPFATPVTVTPERFGTVRRFYVETLRDRAVGNDLQRRMIAAQPVEAVYTLDTDHMPMLSTPHELAAHILAVRARVAEPVPG